MSGAASWQISASDYRAVVFEAGGGLGEVWQGDVRIVQGADPAGPIGGARGQVLAPWPNRLRDGRYEYAGVPHQLALSEPDRANAIHGLARWHAWRLRERTDTTVRLGCRLPARSGYPWTLDLTASYVVSEDGLTVSLGAQNISDSPAPFAAGMHPYLDVGCPADAAVLCFDAATHQLVDDRLLPAGTEAVGATDSYAHGRSLAGTVLDDAFTDLTRDGDGWATVLLAGDHGVQVSMDPAWRWLQVFTGDTLPQGESRTAVAIEPMTAPADAFNSGIDLIHLAPGVPWSGSFRIRRVATSPR